MILTSALLIKDSTLSVLLKLLNFPFKSLYLALSITKDNNYLALIPSVTPKDLFNPVT